MKKKLFLSLVLIILFVFGILIYDFSDEMDTLLTSHKWYINENNQINELEFKDRILAYTSSEGNVLDDYKDCSSYKYNNSVNVIKLSCKGTNKKIYISSYDDERLILSENGNEKIFYSNKDSALIEKFKSDNELSDNEYNKLLSINFNDELFINYKDLKNILKSKMNIYIGVVDNNITFENVYNYQVLNNLINNSSKDFYLININSLTEEELNKVSSITGVDNFNDKVYVFEVKNKKIKSRVIIDTFNKEDILEYNNINI